MKIKKIVCFLYISLFSFLMFCEEKAIIINNPIFSNHYEKMTDEKIQFNFDDKGRIKEEKHLNNNQSFFILINYQQNEIVSYNNNKIVLTRRIPKFYVTINKNSFILENEEEKFIFENGVLFYIKDNVEVDKSQYYFTYRKENTMYIISKHENMGAFKNGQLFDDYMDIYKYPLELINQFKAPSDSVNIQNAEYLISSKFEFLIPFIILNEFVETTAKEYIASSELREKDTIYKAENLSHIDGLPWASANGYGVGDTILITLPRNPYSKLCFYNGFQSNTRNDLFKANSRVKKISIRCLESNKCKEFSLNDITEGQIIDLSDLSMIYNAYAKLEITILDVYPGEKYKDLCIQSIILKY